MYLIFFVFLPTFCLSSLNKVFLHNLFSMCECVCVCVCVCVSERERKEKSATVASILEMLGGKT